MQTIYHLKYACASESRPSVDMPHSERELHRLLDRCPLRLAPFTPRNEEVPPRAIRQQRRLEGTPVKATHLINRSPYPTTLRALLS